MGGLARERVRVVEATIGFDRSRGFGDERRLVEDVEGVPIELIELSRGL